jgi:signal transduction histidine kinase
VSISELRDVEVFEGIPDDVLARIESLGNIEAFPKGAEVIQEGDLVEHMWVILSGTLQIYLNVGGHRALSHTLSQGRVTGYLPFSRLNRSPAWVVTTEPTLTFRVHKERIPELLSLAPVLGQRLVGIMSDRVREFTRGEQQREKMASLGKLSAGLAHELNNPAAAIGRAAASLRDVHERLPRLVSCLAARGLGEDQVRTVGELRQAALERERPRLSALERSELEDALSGWLEEHGVTEGYQHAGALVEGGLTVADLETVEATVPEEALPDVIAWLEASLAADRLLSEIGGASSRISEIVASVKSYSHMDRAPAPEPTDVREGIDSTLVMMAHEIKTKSIRVARQDDPDLPQIPAQAGELNQVWTNLIDNAIDAMTEGGELRIETARDGDFVVVRVIDNGGGIPPEALPKIFDPFFTTKPVGEGTGLGLDISHRIVTQHRGQLTVASRPGRTEFTARLPIS